MATESLLRAVAPPAAHIRPSHLIHIIWIIPFDIQIAWMHHSPHQSPTALITGSAAGGRLPVELSARASARAPFSGGCRRESRMHRTTATNLPTIAAGLIAGQSYAAIGRQLGLTGGAVRAAARKWLPDLMAVRARAA